MKIFVVSGLFLLFILCSTSALSWGGTGGKWSSTVHASERLRLTRCAAAPSANKAVSDKIRVKLLEDMSNVGKKGEITTVSRTMWLNVLQPRKRAVEVTDTQLRQLEADKISSTQKHKADLIELSDAIRSLPTLSVARKTGPNQKMFGSVTSSNILDALKSALPAKFGRLLKSKAVSIVSIEDRGAGGEKAGKGEHGGAGGGADIRSCGEYRITLSLEHDFPPVQLPFHVVPLVS
jgi:large subunit ribosomal protein L9